MIQPAIDGGCLFPEGEGLSRTRVRVCGANSLTFQKKITGVKNEK